MREASIPVYLEVGRRRTFACAIGWPGWSRSGRGEGAALEALAAYGARYARALAGARLGFRAPADPSAFVVVDRLTGDATTDFGAPGGVPAADAAAMDAGALRRAAAILKACWRTFDAAVQSATGLELAKGPRGGGRELEAIVHHALEADAAYLARLGIRFRPEERADPSAELERLRGAMLEALASAAALAEPGRGPRGGVRWTARTFVRRAAWHALDHAWEIEDRAGGAPARGGRA